MLPGKTFNVTIIDDDPLMREMLSDYFTSRFPGSTVNAFTTGEDALAANLDGQQLILLDYHLSVNKKESMNGLQVLRQLNSRYNGLPVIVFSGQDNPEIAAATVQYGAWDYIIKNDNAFNRLGVEVTKLMDRAVLINETAARSKMVRLSILLAAVLFIWLLATKFTG